MTQPDRTPHDIVKPLLRVRQTRQFTEQPPTDEELAAIADVARWSGSGTNSQPWRFIIVRDGEALLRIHDAGLPQTRSLATARAAIAIALPGDDRDVSNTFDEGRAAERMLIAAHFLELRAGIAWVVPGVRDLVAGLLGLPEGWFVRTFIVVGHPTEEGLHPNRPPGQARLPREQVVFEDRWPEGNRG